MRNSQVSFAGHFGDRVKEKLRTRLAFSRSKSPWVGQTSELTLSILRSSTLTEQSNISEESNHNA